MCTHLIRYVKTQVCLDVTCSHADTPLLPRAVESLAAVITSTHSVPVKSAFPTAYTTGRALENVLNICSSPETEESVIVSGKLSSLE